MSSFALLLHTKEPQTISGDIIKIMWKNPLLLELRNSISCRTLAQHRTKELFKMATSELNQFLKEVDKKVLECTICYKRLQNPKLLNCLHSFCLACLEDWVKKGKGKLTCPTCSKSYAIPKGGLQKLPLNTFLINLLETIEQIDKRDEMKCFCEKGEAKNYCQECRLYLCSTCSNCHNTLPVSTNHKLHTVENVQSMSAQDFALLCLPLCLLHNKPVEFYCTECKTSICINCTLMGHKLWEVKHKPIRISEVLQTLTETGLKNNESASLQKCDIRNVNTARVTECLMLQREESVSQDQTVIKIIKTDECEIHANQLKATWTHPTGETYTTEIEEDKNGIYFVTGNNLRPGICKLDVNVDGEAIKQSPMMVKIEKVAVLINTIKINQIYVRDVVMCEDDCLLVSCSTNVILKYKQSGENIGKVTLARSVQVYKMQKLKNGNIAFSDWGNQCIQICSMNGQLVKSVGKEVLKNPFGIHVDEGSNIVYVADWETRCVLLSIDSGEMIRKIGSQGNIQQGKMIGMVDVTLTKEGHLLILEYSNHRLQLFDKEGMWVKVLIKAGDENGKIRNPDGVVVDADDNIIISCKNKLQLFSKNGNFIKRIDKDDDGINNPEGIAIISYYPRKVAVANNGDKTLKIFNY
ncbi:tripartite motif-containing protein 2-like [Anneissia japonica]|uniref:tripartite motif-containing protein 2-like n=1 Tax=Anneissia japonica TaxID=1529436 RepID=UPI0014256FDB|nr:tripartite motif-containing protein 2-like [Anneissia japonica]